MTSLLIPTSVTKATKYFEAEENIVNNSQSSWSYADQQDLLQIKIPFKAIAAATPRWHQAALRSDAGTPRCLNTCLTLSSRL